MRATLARLAHVSFFSVIMLMTASGSHAGYCENIAEITKKIGSKVFKSLTQGKEYVFPKLGSFEQARNLVQGLPINLELDISFGSIRRERVIGNLEASILKNKRVGWTVRSPKAVATYRLDWDPQKGAHFNVIYTTKGAGAVTYKAAIPFDCAGKPCTADQVLRLSKQFGG